MHRSVWWVTSAGSEEAVPAGCEDVQYSTVQ